MLSRSRAGEETTFILADFSETILMRIQVSSEALWAGRHLWVGNVGFQPVE